MLRTRHQTASDVCDADAAQQQAIYYPTSLISTIISNNLPTATDSTCMCAVDTCRTLNCVCAVKFARTVWAGTGGWVCAQVSRPSHAILTPTTGQSACNWCRLVASRLITVGQWTVSVERETRVSVKRWRWWERRRRANGDNTLISNQEQTVQVKLQWKKQIAGWCSACDGTNVAIMEVEVDKNWTNINGTQHPVLAPLTTCTVTVGI